MRMRLIIPYAGRAVVAPVTSRDPSVVLGREEGAAGLAAVRPIVVDYRRYRGPVRAQPWRAIETASATR